MKFEKEIKKLMNWDVKHFKSVKDYSSFGFGQIEHRVTWYGIKGDCRRNGASFAGANGDSSQRTMQTRPA